jgi:hypothetical protein
MHPPPKTLKRLSSLLYIRCEEDTTQSTSNEARISQPRINLDIGNVCNNASVSLSPAQRTAQALHSFPTQAGRSSTQSNFDAERLQFSPADTSLSPLLSTNHTFPDHSHSPRHLLDPTATSQETTFLEAQPYPAAAALQQPVAAYPAETGAPVERERAAIALSDAQIAEGKDGLERQPCYLCMDRRADAVLIECGHGGMCAVCATVLWRRAAAAPAAERRCPLCRVPFVGVMLIVGEAAGTVRAARFPPKPSLHPLRPGPVPHTRDRALIAASLVGCVDSLFLPCIHRPLLLPVPRDGLLPLLLPAPVCLQPALDPMLLCRRGWRRSFTRACRSLPGSPR